MKQILLALLAMAGMTAISIATAEAKTVYVPPPQVYYDTVAAM